ncbi:MAG: ABC transporter ATP-binding protein [Candidatus Bathyarchaeia archaeon]
MKGAELFLDNIVKIFRIGKRNAITAVDHISLTVPSGALVTLLGPSGCGKTTTLRLVGGFEFPDEGEIYLDNKRITFLPPQQRPTATVFQSYALFPHMTVFQNVAYGLKVRRLNRREINHRVQEALRLVGLSDFASRMPFQLSGGQQQRVALARVLAIKPKVILFDEPLSNLDAKLRVETRAQIRRLQRDLGLTSLYVTHDQSEAMAISDYVAVMNHGRIQQFGTPREVYLQPTNKFVAEFIGEASFLKAKILEKTEATMKCLLHNFYVLECKNIPNINVGDEGFLVLRPEFVELLPVESNDDYLVGQISLIELTGSIVTYQIRLQSNEVVIVKKMGWLGNNVLNEGTYVKLKINVDTVHFVKG